jgi:hypothetical protein
MKLPIFDKIATVALVVALVTLLLAAPALARSGDKLQGSHGDRSVMPKGCRACHRGMSMAISGEEKSCVPCHSDSAARSEMQRQGYLKDTGKGAPKSIVAELSKPYNHPVSTVSGVHQRNEALPEEVVNAARHSECVDCHEVHLVEKGNPFRGIKGRRVGNFIADIENEYELCYRCHAESANLPGNATNKHEEFNPTNPSFHPVEAEGKNTFVVSLLKPYVTQEPKPNEVSRMTCSDCHGSDDAAAPKGPHGSYNPGLLVLNYDIDDERSESERAYELCYKCHDRTSILANESFPFHALHIQGRTLAGDGTSCFTCHDAHGSSSNRHLIRFNEAVVSENAAGRLRYETRGIASRGGRCYLSCHGVDHDPKEY